MSEYADLSVNDWVKEALRIAKEHGVQPTSIYEDIAKMHMGLSKALTRCIEQGPLVHWVNGDTPEGMPSELAKVIAQILLFAGQQGIDIEAALQQVMAYAAMPPKAGGLPTP